MTNDILEQLTEDYLRELGYFTQHNISYKPETWKQVPSDIDIIAVHPKKKGIEKVIVVSCKSWREGVRIKTVLKHLEERPICKWKKHFREVANNSWSEGLRAKVFELTGQKNFVFCVSATHFIGERKIWEQYPLFNENLEGCKISTLDFKDMVNLIFLKMKTEKMPAHSSLSRTLQLVHASKGNISF